MSESLQIPEVLDDELKKIERAKVDQEASGMVIPEDGKLDISVIMTPAEHKLVGSTFAGLAFSSNEPRAYSAGMSLEEMNDARKNAIQTFLASTLDSQGEKKYLGIKVALEPLTQEQVMSNDYVQSFKIFGATNAWRSSGPRKIPEDITERLAASVEEGKRAAREELIRQLMKR